MTEQRILFGPPVQLMHPVRLCTCTKCANDKLQ